MTTTRIVQGDTEPIIAMVVDGVGGPVSGATITTRVQRLSDNFFFDWADDTFKVFGSVGSPDQALTEFTNQAAIYRLDTATHDEGLDTGAITNVTADDIYIATFDVTAPVGAVGPGPIEIKVDQWVKDTRDAAIAAHFLGCVHINVNSGTAGTDPEVNGAPGLPVDTLADALTISAARNTREFVIENGVLTLTAALNEWFTTLRDESEVQFAGFSVNGSEFCGGILKGVMTGSVTIRRSSLEDVSGLLGHVSESGIEGEIVLASGETSFDACFSHVPGMSVWTLKFVAGATCNIRAYSGGIQIEDMTDPANTLSVEFVAGKPIIDSSCTAGVIEIRGVGEPLVDNSGPGCAVDTSGYINGQVVRDAMKLAPAAGAPTAGSIDAHLDTLIAGVVLTGAAVTAIWDEDVTGREASPDTAARIQDMQNKIMRGRIRTNPTLNRLELYDPVDDTALLTWPLTDFGGLGILNAVGAPFDRAKAEET
ncbi:MAG: hypothetical protein V3W41_22130 [Planctomycetota bacterium]